MTASLYNSSLFPGCPSSSAPRDHRNYRTRIWSNVAPAPLPPRDVVLSRSVPLPGGHFGVQHEPYTYVRLVQSAPLPYQGLMSSSATSSSLGSTSVPASPRHRNVASAPLPPRPAPALSSGLLARNPAPARVPLVLSPEQKKQMTSNLAYCIYEERVRSSVGGDADGDWYMAESRLNEFLLGRPVGDITLPQSFRPLAFINVRRCLAGLLNEAARRR